MDASSEGDLWGQRESSIDLINNDAGIRLGIDERSGWASVFGSTPWEYSSDLKSIQETLIYAVEHGGDLPGDFDLNLTGGSTEWIIPEIDNQ